MAKKDFYDVLGVPKKADTGTIRKAYRKLAKKYHPDSNPGDAAAEQKFKEVTEAYNVLSDAEKKKLYDQFGMAAFEEGFDPGRAQNGSAYGGFGNYGGYGNYGNAAGGSGFGNGGFYQNFGGGSGWQEVHFDSDGSGMNMDDILKNMFGGFSGQQAQAQQPQDMEADLSVSFEEAAFGGDKTISLRGADGKTNSLKVHIPAGIDEGKKIRLRGKGGVGAGGKQGDLLLRVHIQPKVGYERKGMDVYTTARIPYTTAVLGGEAVVPTLQGSVVCKIPAGTQSGKKLRLKGKGIVSMKNGHVRGDQFVTLQIDVPQHISSEARKKLEEYARIMEKDGSQRSA